MPQDAKKEETKKEEEPTKQELQDEEIEKAAGGIMGNMQRGSKR
jgi:hypothetical protein